MRYLNVFWKSCIGFEHTAFNFANESMIADTRVVDEQVEPGALIMLLQKALRYMELEAHVRDVSCRLYGMIHIGWLRSRMYCSLLSYSSS